MDFMHSWYEKKGVEWKKSDFIIWNFWARIFPYIIFIPIMFMFFRWFMIDYLLAKKGFEEAVMWLGIIMIIRPTIMELLTKILTFKKDISKK